MSEMRAQRELVKRGISLLLQSAYSIITIPSFFSTIPPPTPLFPLF